MKFASFGSLQHATQENLQGFVICLTDIVCHAFMSCATATPHTGYWGPHATTPCANPTTPEGPKRYPVFDVTPQLKCSHNVELFA